MCRPEQGEDADPLGSVEDGLVLRQQLRLVATQRRRRLFVQQSRQRLHGVPTSVSRGVIDYVRLWLERSSEKMEWVFFVRMYGQNYSSAG